MKFKKWIECEKGPDNRMVTFAFYLKGKKGVIQFKFWVQGPPVDRDSRTVSVLPVDVGYHAYEPQWEGDPGMGPCDLLDGKDCFYDGSSLAATSVWKDFLEQGPDVVWKILEERYTNQFGTADA